MELTAGLLEAGTTGAAAETSAEDGEEAEGEREAEEGEGEGEDEGGGVEDTKGREEEEGGTNGSITESFLMREMRARVASMSRRIFSRRAALSSAVS